MTIRSIIGRGGLALAVGMAATAAMAVPAAAASDLAVAFDCTTVEVESSGKDLSNVVLRFADGDQKFDNLRGTSGTFAGTGAFAGEPVAAVFVKAGNNGAGEGPGYGERIDAPSDSCGSTPSTAPAADQEDGPDDGQEPHPATEGAGAEVDAELDCDNTTVTVTSTKDLSNVVLRLSDGSDVKFEGLSGPSATFDAPPGTTIVAVFVKSGNNGSGAGPGYGEQVDAPAASCGNEPAASNSPPPAPVATPTEDAASDMAPAPAVKVPASSEVTERAAPAIQPARRSAEVLGVRLEREVPAAPAPATAALAFTGITLEWLLLAAGVLLSMGTALVRVARRPARMLAR